MALRKIRTEGDPVLTKVSRPVTEMTPKLRTLIFDSWIPCMRKWAWDLLLLR